VAQENFARVSNIDITTNAVAITPELLNHLSLERRKAAFSSEPTRECETAPSAPAAGRCKAVALRGARKARYNPIISKTRDAPIRQARVITTTVDIAKVGALAAGWLL